MIIIIIVLKNLLFDLKHFQLPLCDVDRATCIENIVRFGYVVLEIRAQTDKHTDAICCRQRRS